MKLLVPVALLALALCAALRTPTEGGTIVIGFDDIVGQPPPFADGTPVTVLVNDEYSNLGVLFDSAGGGLCVAAPSNPVSPPNSVSATEPGPVISYSVPAEARFVLPDGRAGVVDSFALTGSNTTSPFFVEYYDCFDNLLGTDAGGELSTLTGTAVRLIHRVVIHQGPMAFDDFTFTNLRVPEFILDGASPGLAGVVNAFTVCGADPGTTVVYAIGTLPGSSAVPDCAPTAFGMADPLLLGVQLVSADGCATLSAFVPGSFDGQIVRIQAAQIEDCRITNLVEQVFAPPTGARPGVLRRERGRTGHGQLVQPGPDDCPGPR